MSTNDIIESAYFFLHFYIFIVIHWKNISQFNLLSHKLGFFLYKSWRNINVEKISMQIFLFSAYI